MPCSVGPQKGGVVVVGALARQMPGARDLPVVDAVDGLVERDGAAGFDAGMTRGGPHHERFAKAPAHFVPGALGDFVGVGALRLHHVADRSEPGQHSRCALRRIVEERSPQGIAGEGHPRPDRDAAVAPLLVVAQLDPIALDVHLVAPAVGQGVGEVHHLGVAAVLREELGSQAQRAEHPGQPLPERLPGRDRVRNDVERIAVASPHPDLRQPGCRHLRGRTFIRSGCKRDGATDELGCADIAVRAPDLAACEVAERVDELYPAERPGVVLAVERDHLAHHAGPGPDRLVVERFVALGLDAEVHPCAPPGAQAALGERCEDVDARRHACGHSEGEDRMGAPSDVVAFGGDERSKHEPARAHDEVGARRDGADHLIGWPAVAPSSGPVSGPVSGPGAGLRRADFLVDRAVLCVGHRSDPRASRLARFWAVPSAPATAPFRAVPVPSPADRSARCCYLLGHTPFTRFSQVVHARPALCVLFHSADITRAT